MRVTFVHADGVTRTEVEGRDGHSLLAAGQQADMPLEGTCEGQMACSTCHVIVSPDWFARLPGAVAMEEDMLDLATGATRTSRLSCQILLTDDLDGLEVRLPSASRNMQGI